MFWWEGEGADYGGISEGRIWHKLRYGNASVKPETNSIQKSKQLNLAAWNWLNIRHSIHGTRHRHSNVEPYDIRNRSNTTFDIWMSRHTTFDNLMLSHTTFDIRILSRATFDIWRIRAVWSESSLGIFCIAKDTKFLHPVNEDSDQTARICKLIWVFVSAQMSGSVFSRGSFSYKQLSEKMAMTSSQIVQVISRVSSRRTYIENVRGKRLQRRIIWIKSIISLQQETCYD